MEPAEVIAPAMTVDGPVSGSWLIALNLASWGGPLGASLASGSASGTTASGGGVWVLFDGALYDREELFGVVRDPDVEQCSDAELLRRAYLRLGADLLRRVRGVYSLVIADSGAEQVLCARDPMGTYPLYYFRSGDSLLVANAMAPLVERIGPSAPVDPAALADRFRNCYPLNGETYRRGIFRVPVGAALRADRHGCTLLQSWDPLAAPVERVSPREARDHFSELFRQAVHRSLALGKPALYLSGGVDSVSIAAAAADLADRGEGVRPNAYCLGIAGERVDETVTQRVVAERLALPYRMMSLDEELGSHGLIPAALQLTRRMSAPLISPWMAAYEPMARHAAREGHQTVLTGVGGDEWLTVNPILAADLLRSADVSGFWRLYGAIRSGYAITRTRALRALLWRYGAQPLLRDLLSGAGGLRGLRRLAPTGRRSLPYFHGWLAPDPQVRAELEERDRAMQEWLSAPNRQESRHREAVRYDLEHPLTSMQADELSESARLQGLRLLKPLSDPELLEFVLALPPQTLLTGGMQKGLLREPLARRFPELRFDQHRKVDTGPYFRAELFKQAAALYRELGGTPALAGLGVVDADRLQSQFKSWIASGSGDMADAIWTVLNVEAWTQAQLGGFS